MSEPAYAYDDAEEVAQTVEEQDRLEWELQCALHDCMEQFGTSRTLGLVMDIVSRQEVGNG